MRIMYHARPFLFEFISIIVDEEYKSQALHYVISCSLKLLPLFWHTHFLRPLFENVLNLRTPLMMEDQVAYLYKTTSKIIVLNI